MIAEAMALKSLDLQSAGRQIRGIGSGPSIGTQTLPLGTSGRSTVRPIRATTDPGPDRARPADAAPSRGIGRTLRPSYSVANYSTGATASWRHCVAAAGCIAS